MILLSFFFSDYFFRPAAFLETVLLALAYFCRSFLNRQKTASVDGINTYCCIAAVLLPVPVTWTSSWLGHPTCSFLPCSGNPVLPPSDWYAFLWSSCHRRSRRAFRCRTAATTVQGYNINKEPIFLLTHWLLVLA